MPRPTTPSTGLKSQNQTIPTAQPSLRFRSPSAGSTQANQNLIRGMGIMACGLVGLFAHSRMGHELSGMSENLLMWVNASRESQIFVIDHLNSTFEQIPMTWGIALVIFIWGIALALTFIVSLRETQSEPDHKISEETPMNDDDSDDDWNGMPGRRLIH